MIQALGLEVAAIQKKGGGNQVELRGGERLGQSEGGWLYKFLLSEDAYFRDDTPVRIICGQEDIPGTLISFRDGVLVVAIEKDLGPTINLARLVTNDSFLLERLKEQLEKVGSGELQFNRQSAERVIGLSPIQAADANIQQESVSDFNQEQSLAVRRSLGSQTTFVWGPPGTGKTTTLARIVEAHYRAGRSVLLVSNTNIAVDTALERVAERLLNEPGFQEGLLIRQGPVVKEELRKNFGPQVILEEIVARLGQALNQEKEKLVGEAASLESRQAGLRSTLKDLENLEQARQALATMEKQLYEALHGLKEKKEKAAAHRKRLLELRADLERAQGMGSLRRLFSGLNPKRLESAIATEDLAAWSSEDAAENLRKQAVLHKARWQGMQAEVEALTASTQNYPPLPEVRAGLGALADRLAKIGERISAIEHELEALVEQVLERCRVLGTTVYRTYLNPKGPRHFDVVVVDEASMLMPPLVYFAAGLANKAVTVTGDFRQLPPIVMSNEQLAEDWLKKDVFEKAGIPELLSKGQSISHLVALGTQYRMREPICEVINKFFYYDKPLISDARVANGGSGFPFGPSPLMYVDTSSFHPWTVLRVGTYSRYNLFHALLVRNIVLHLAESGFLPPTGEANHKIGVVAPYAAQARLIQVLLEDRLSTRAAGISATVHRFQGNEKEAMVIDLTDSLGAPVGRFLQAANVREDGARLLNVAASRARDHVILMANFEYLRAKAHGDAIVRGLLDHFLKHGQQLDADKILPLGAEDWIDGLHSITPNSFEFKDKASGAFNEGSFYSAFLADIARVRDSLLILSPFATRMGAGRWVDAFRAAMSRGVRLRVITRPPAEWGGGTTDEVYELVRDLLDTGVAVDLRHKMHEKIAIIDGRVLWHGSLNILSHRDTHESMLRIESPEACKQVSKFISMGNERGDNGPHEGVSDNPVCPECGAPTVWINGRYGVFYQCVDASCGCKVDPRRGGKNKGKKAETRQGKAKTGAGNLTCPKPGCGGMLVERNGRYGRFLGCSNYPKCRYTQSLH